MDDAVWLYEFNTTCPVSLRQIVGDKERLLRRRLWPLPVWRVGQAPSDAVAVTSLLPQGL